jgi:hypothetical protein
LTRFTRPLRYRQRRADVATKRATAHALVSLSSSRPAGHFHPVCAALDRNWSAAGAGAGTGKDFPVSSTTLGAPAMARTQTRDIIVPAADGASRVPPSAAHGEGDQDCPIDRLLRAMACVKPNESNPQTVGSCGPVCETAVNADRDVKPPKEAVGLLEEGAAMAADGSSAAAGAEDDCTRGQMIVTAVGAARRAEQVEPPRRFGGGCGGAIGLEALACTAAEILTRSFRPPAASAAAPASLAAALLAAPPGVGAGCGGARRERADAQLSALSTPPFSPEVAALPAGILPPAPHLALSLVI